MSNLFDIPLPALLGQPQAKPARDHLVFHNGGIRGPFAIRQGVWKLIPTSATNARQTEAGKAGQLFNLDDDLSESQNLAKKYPEKVKALTALLERVRGTAVDSAQ